MISEEESLVNFAKLVLVGRALRPCTEATDELIAALSSSSGNFSFAYAFTCSLTSFERVGSFLERLNELEKGEKVVSLEPTLKSSMASPKIAEAMLIAANAQRDTELSKRILELIEIPNERTYYLIIDTAFKSLKAEQALGFYRQYKESFKPTREMLQLMIRNLCKYQMLSKALECFKEVRSTNQTLDTESVLLLLECCFKQGNDGREVFNYHKEAADSRCYSAYIKALCKSGSANEAVPVLEEMKARFGGEECPYYLLVEALARSGNLPDAFKYFVKAKNEDAAVRTSTYNVLIEAYVKIENVPKAWDLLEDMRESKVEADSYTYTHIFKAIKENKSDLLRAAEQLKRLEKEGSAVLDVILYNLLLDAFVSNRMLFHACQLLDSLESPQSPVNPDEISYNTVIKGCGQTKNLAKAFDFLERMKAHSVAPNEVTYNSLIDVCVRCGDLEAAWKQLPAMESSGLTPDNFTYSTLIKGVHPKSDRNGLKRVFELFNEMKRKGKVRPDEILYNCLMDACVRFRDTCRAVAIFNEMELAEIPPSAITYGILIKAYGQANQLDNVFKVFKRMQNKGYSPNAVTYGCLIDSCIKNGAMGKALGMYEKMLKDGIKPNTIIYTTLIKGFTKTKNLKGAMDIYQKMILDPNSPPNNVTYNSLLDCCAKCNDLRMLDKLFDEMKSTKNQPDLITFSTVIKGYCRGGKLTAALRLLETMEEQRIRPDEVLFNSLLDGCAKKGEMEIALEIYAKMSRTHVKPSEITYSILLKVFARSKMKAKDVVSKGKEAVVNMLAIFTYGNYTKEAVDLLAKVRTEELRLGKSIYIELMKVCIARKDWDKAATVAVKGLRENPEYGKSESVYRELVEKLLEAKNPAAETICELMERHSSESKQMFKPIVDSGNRACIKSEAKEKPMQGKGSENMNIHNTVNKKGSAENKVAFAAEKGAVEEDADGRKTEERHFTPKPADFDAAVHYKNSKATEPKGSVQSKIARLV